MTKTITLKKYDYDSMIMVRLYVKGHGNLTLAEISFDGMRNLCGNIYDPEVDLDDDSRLKIIGVDTI